MLLQNLPFALIFLLATQPLAWAADDKDELFSSNVTASFRHLRSANHRSLLGDVAMKLQDVKKATQQHALENPYAENTMEYFSPARSEHPNYALDVPFYVYEEVNWAETLTFNGNPIKEMEDLTHFKETDDYYLPQAALNLHPMRTRDPGMFRSMFGLTPSHGNDPHILHLHLYT